MLKEILIGNVRTDINDEACNNDRSVEAMEFGLKEPGSAVRMICVPEVILLTRGQKPKH